jgi:hypothetical protein
MPFPAKETSPFKYSADKKFRGGNGRCLPVTLLQKIDATWLIFIEFQNYNKNGPYCLQILFHGKGGFDSKSSQT